MTWQDAVLIVGILGITVGIVMLGIIIYVLLSGVYKDYAKMRENHLAQSKRVKESLERGRNELQ
jgi:hypothetical protein